MNTYKNETFLQACKAEKPSHTPIWLMRQAGRYMKEYRDVRSKVGFLELCKSPNLVSEVTVTAAEILNVDAAIIFADILLITESFGFELEFIEGKGPTIHNPLRQANDVNTLPDPDVMDSLGYVGEAISRTKKDLANKIPLIGFAGAPFTVASYIIEGGSSRNFENTKSFMRSQPEAWKKFLDKISKATSAYLAMQIEKGADAIQLFDSWIGALSASDYDEFIYPFVQPIFNELRLKYPNTPSIYFGVNNAHLIENMSRNNPDVMGIDFHMPLKQTWDQLDCKAVQGNLDPTTLFCKAEVIKEETKKILDSVNGKPGHIFNLGHGILPTTPVDHAKLLIDFVHEYSNQNQ